MASSSFSFLRFVENAGVPHIKRYFEKVAIPNTLPDDADAEMVVAFIKSLSLTDARRIEDDFVKVNYFVDIKGTLDLLKEAAERAIPFPELESEEARALWCFIEYPDLLDAAYVWGKIDDFTRWDEEEATEINANTDWNAKANLLSQHFKQHFLDEEDRQIECCTEVFVREDRVSFVIYPEGFPRAVLTYNNGKVHRKSSRPIQEIYFVLHLRENKVSFHSSVRFAFERISKFKKLFFQNTLEQNFTDGQSQRFDLSRFLDRAFGTTLQLVLPPADNVQYVKVVEISLKDKDNRNHEMTLRTKDSSDTYLAEIYDMLQQHNVREVNVFVKSVKIRIQFPGGRAGSRTFVLSYPASHGLGNDGNELKCRAYLSLWGIVHE